MSLVCRNVLQNSTVCSLSHGMCVACQMNNSCWCAVACVWAYRFYQILYESRCSAPSTCFLLTSRLLFAAWQEVFGFVCLLLKRGLQWAKWSWCKFSDWQVNITSNTFSEYYNTKTIFINVDVCSDPELNPSLTKNVQAHHFKLCVQGCVYFILFFCIFLCLEIKSNRWLISSIFINFSRMGAQLRGPSLWFETNSLLTPFKTKVWRAHRVFRLISNPEHIVLSLYCFSTWFAVIIKCHWEGGWRCVQNPAFLIYKKNLGHSHPHNTPCTGVHVDFSGWQNVRSVDPCSCADAKTLNRQGRMRGDRSKAKNKYQTKGKVLRPQLYSSALSRIKSLLSA